MRVIGVFRELEPGGNQSMQSIHEVVGILNDNLAKLILDYLSSGITVFDVMGVTIDPIDKTTCISGGPGLVTDGEWIWREDLKYFVEKYNVGLPQDFLNHVSREILVRKDASIIVSRVENIVAAYNSAVGSGWSLNSTV